MSILFGIHKEVYKLAKELAQTLHRLSSFQPYLENTPEEYKLAKQLA